jgi:hypothetical protein
LNSLLAFALGLALISLTASAFAAEPAESPRVKAVREKVLTHKLKVDIDRKMLEPLLKEVTDLIKNETSIEVKIDKVPGTAGVTFTSSFGPLKGEMTLEEILAKICEDKNWGWYVNLDKPGDQKDGRIYLTTNSKEHGYKEGTGPATGKEAAKKDPPKTKEKPKEDPKGGGDDKAAAELLTKAKLQVNLKQSDKAKVTLNEIIEKHPDSKQAAEAKKLLEKIGK